MLRVYWIPIALLLANTFSGCDLDPLECCLDDGECECEAERRPLATSRYQYVQFEGSVPSYESMRRTDPEELRANLRYFKQKLEKALEEDRKRRGETMESPTTTEEELSPFESPATAVRKRGLSTSAIIPAKIHPKFEPVRKLSGRYSPEASYFPKWLKDRPEVPLHLPLYSESSDSDDEHSPSESQNQEGIFSFEADGQSENEEEEEEMFAFEEHRNK